jgi:hypothetical protein
VLVPITPSAASNHTHYRGYDIGAAPPLATRLANLASRKHSAFPQPMGCAYHSGSVATFASLSLKRRAVAALNVLDACPGLSIAERHELVYLAVWPSDVALPGPVRRDSLVTPNVDLRPTPPPPPRVGTAEDQARAREQFQGGESIAAIAEDLGVPWLTARKWVRGRR